MSPELTDRDRELLFVLQRGLPLHHRPFRDAAHALGLDEEDVVARATRFVQDGLLRRFGAVFDARRLGYRSALCALNTPATELEPIASELARHKGITHCYQRGWPDELAPSLRGAPQGQPMPPLWFTLSTLADRFEADLSALGHITGPNRLLVLPAERRFKIDVVFDPRKRDQMETFPGAADYRPTNDESTISLSEREMAMVRVLQGNLPVRAEPFTDVAAHTGCTPREVVETLTRWSAAGVLRRFAFIARHRRLGFRANAMCVWLVGDESVVEKGRRLAQAREVTHCYQRVVDPRFPYTLYAMIHTQAWRGTHELFVRLEDATGLENGRLLFSLREFKKSSMQYFEEDKIESSQR